MCRAHAFPLAAAVLTALAASPTIAQQAPTRPSPTVENAAKPWPPVATFSVLDGDYYGTGKLYPPGWEANGVLLRYRWESS